jgi:hypothetical protein
MAEPVPVACTLTADELRDRSAAWNKLMTSGLVGRERVAGGIRLHAGPEASSALMELVERERECCAWIRFDVQGDSVTMTAEAAGEAVLATMFNDGPDAVIAVQTEIVGDV